MQYLISRSNQSEGPYPSESIREALAKGHVSVTDLCWTEGMSGWVPIGSREEFAALAPAPSKAPVATETTVQTSPPKRPSGYGSLLWIGCSLLILVGLLVGSVALWRMKNDVAISSVPPKKLSVSATNPSASPKTDATVAPTSTASSPPPPTPPPSLLALIASKMPEASSDIDAANSGVAVNPDDIADEDDPLIGQNKIRVTVEINGDNDISPETYQSDIEGSLREAGITILPDQTGVYPRLDLQIDVTSTDERVGYSITPYVLYTIQLKYMRLHPSYVHNKKAKYMMGIVWTTAYHGYRPAIQSLAIRNEVADQLTSDFITAYKKANNIK